MKKIVKDEFDDRIPEIRAEAIKKRDNDWEKIIEEYYVEKKVVAELEEIIKLRDTTIAILDI